MDEEDRYNEIAESMAPAGVTKGSLFGKPCLKIGSKSFACFFQEAMVFKLDPDSLNSAISLPGTKHFDPSGSGRPMKQWVQVPFEHADRWPELADQALRYALE